VTFEESTTPDLVELARLSLEALNRGDFDTAMSVWGPDPVWDTSPMGLGVFEGRGAIRSFFEDWISAFEDFDIETEEVLELGSEVTFSVAVQRGRPVGSDARVEWRYAAVSSWVDGSVVRVTNYSDVAEARAAAERLAEERG
jgi:ketosteroid isomerase-like protein